jgi:hypothetical protein
MNENTLQNENLHLKVKPYLQRFSCSEQTVELLLGHIDLSPVHEVNQRPHFPKTHVFHENNWVLARVVTEKLFEIGAARGQDNLVALDHLSLASNRNVHEVLICQQFGKRILQVGLVAVPADAKLLGLGSHLKTKKQAVNTRVRCITIGTSRQSDITVRVGGLPRKVYNNSLWL